MSPAGVPRRQFAILFWVSMLGAIGVSSMLTLLPSVGRTAHIPDALIVTAQALSAIGWVFVAGHWTRLSDRKGRRHVMLIGAGGLALASLLTGAAILIGINHWVPPMVALAALVAGRSAHGMIGLASGPAAQAFIVERTSPEKRTAALSSLASAQGLGSVAGPALAPFLLLPGLDLAGPMFTVAALGFVTLPLVALILPAAIPATPRRPEGHESLWRIPAVRPHLVYSAIIALAMAGSIQTIGFLVIDTVHVAPAEAQPLVGRAILCGALAALVVQLVLVPLFRPSPRILMIAGPLAALAGLAALATLPGYAMIVAATVAMQAGLAAARPGVSAAASLAVPMSRQAEVAGAMLSTLAVGIVAGPVLGVALYGAWAPLPFLLLAGAMAAACGIAIRDARGNMPAPPEPEIATEESAPLA